MQRRENRAPEQQVHGPGSHSAFHRRFRLPTRSRGRQHHEASDSPNSRQAHGRRRPDRSNRARSSSALAQDDPRCGAPAAQDHRVSPSGDDASNNAKITREILASKIHFAEVTVPLRHLASINSDPYRISPQPPAANFGWGSPQSRLFSRYLTQRSLPPARLRWQDQFFAKTSQKSVKTGQTTAGDWLSGDGFDCT